MSCTSLKKLLNSLARSIVFPTFVLRPKVGKSLFAPRAQKLEAPKCNFDFLFFEGAGGY